MRQRAVGNAVQIGGSLSVKLLQSFSLFLIQPAIWPAFQCREQRFQVSPPWQRLSLKSFEIQDHRRCSRLFTRYPSTAVRRNFSAGVYLSWTFSRDICRANAPSRWFSLSPVSAAYTS